MDKADVVWLQTVKIYLCVIAFLNIFGGNNTLWKQVQRIKRFLDDNL